MNLSPIAFYALSAGLVVSAMLSTTLPQSRTSTGARVVLFLFCLGLLLASKLGAIGLIISAFCLSFLIIVALESFSALVSVSKPNLKIDFLIWIVLGSFLLIIAVVLKYTNWAALRLENVTDWKMILSEYVILLTFPLICLIAGLLWRKSKPS